MKQRIPLGPYVYGTREFLPNGKFHGRGTGGRLLANEVAGDFIKWSSSAPMLSARLFVGFNVGEKPRWTLADLMALVRRVLEQQTGDPSSTFIAQRGFYLHRDTRYVVEEDGAQVVIFPDSDEPRDSFEARMVELARVIAADMQQAEVIVDISRGGISQQAYGVGP
jgi:hypothetical protein